MADWTLAVASRRPVPGWLGEAHRLRALLDVVSDAVADQYGGRLSWRNPETTEQQWTDPAQIASYMETRQLRDDVGVIMKGGGAHSSVQGYLPEARKELINALWGAGNDDWPFNCVLTFTKAARCLHEHPLDWLVNLLAAASAAVHADEATIGTHKTNHALVDVREDHGVGVIMLIPHKIDRAALPASLTVHNGPAHHPDDIIVAADPLQAANDPQSVVADLLRVDDLLRAQR